MSYCPGSNRPPAYSNHATKKTTSIKKTVGIGTENQLRRIVKEEFKLDYDELKTHNKRCISLYADGMSSVYLIRENNIATLTYTDGRMKKYLIPSS